MFELLNETLFEKHMAEYLAGSKMYNQRTPKDFNIQKLVDSDMLLQFLREQPILGLSLSSFKRWSAADT
jgi:type I restriction enzyme, R subunit